MHVIKLQSRPRWKNCLHCHDLWQQATALLKIWNVDTSCEEKYGSECVFPERSVFVATAPRPALICFSGEDVVSAGRLCWWVNWYWRWGVVGWCSLFLEAWAAENICRYAFLRGYNKNRGTPASQSHFHRLLLPGHPCLAVMVKRRNISVQTLRPHQSYHINYAKFKAWVWFFCLYQDFQETQSDLEVILEFLEEYYKQNPLNTLPPVTADKMSWTLEEDSCRQCWTCGEPPVSTENTSFEDARFGHMWKRAPASSFCARLSTTLHFSLCWCTTSRRLSAKTNQHRRASVGHCQKLQRDKQPNILPQQQGVVSSAFYGHYTRLLPTLLVAGGKDY